MSKKLNRREFIGGTVAVAVTCPVLGQNIALPSRGFGRTRLRPSTLALGCGNRLHMAYPSQDRGIEAIELALDRGINFLDTAQSYGNGKSERWVGKAIQGHRKEVIIATKTRAREADELLRSCEESLKRLQTDYLDILHIHSLEWADDLRKVEAKGGVLEVLYKLRDQRVVRFIGITSHTDPETLAIALERHDFDCTQMVLNAGQQGRSPDGRGSWKKVSDDPFSEAIPPKPDERSFQKVALPVAVSKKMGIIAMKVTGQDSLVGTGFGKAPARELLRYSLSLPVSLVTSGMPKLRYIRENTEMVRNFQPMCPSEIEGFSHGIVEANKADA